MAVTNQIATLDYTVKQCPECGESHVFTLAVKNDSAPAVPIFGGTGGREIAFTCPKTHKLFTQVVANPPGREILGLADPATLAAAAQAQPSAPIPAGPAASAPPIGGASDLADWVKSSRATALDYSKLMLSTSTGAIPLYFVVMKFIGIEKISASIFSRAGIFPPLLFLLAGVFFVLALRPQYAMVAEADFAAFRKSRLEQLNRYITLGTALFILGMLLAVVLLFLSLTNP